MVCKSPATNRSLVLSLKSSLDPLSYGPSWGGGRGGDVPSLLWQGCGLGFSLDRHPLVSISRATRGEFTSFSCLVWLRFFHLFGCLQIQGFGSLGLLFLLKKRLSRKPFGSAGEVLTFREEPVLTEVLGFIWFIYCCGL